MALELSGSARPRPLRIAYLVQDGEHSDFALDGIFADCYDRWGGRFSLIAPCVDGRVLPTYWPWLEAFDPDIVYSYVPLCRDDILQVHERLSPAEYIFHKHHGEPTLDLFSFKPRYDFAPLSSLSTIFRQARFGPGIGMAGGPVHIIDAWSGEQRTRFLTDNFGTYLTSRGTSLYPSDGYSGADLLTIVAPENMANRQFGIPQNLITVPNEVEAFAAYAAKRATSMSYASLVFAPKLEIYSWEWSGSFNLVVGNSFADRVMFWNARLLLPSWLDTDLYCLRIDEDQLGDQEFVRVLGDTLKYRNHVNGGAGGQSQLIVRSCSVPAERLEAARAIIAGTKPWGAVSTAVIPNLDALVPKQEDLKNARENLRSTDGVFGRAAWTQFTWTMPSARPPAASPDHLSDAPPRQSFTQGYWTTDYLLEQAGPAARFIGQGQWELSRRWRMAGAFQITRVDGAANQHPPPPRRSRLGALSIPQNADHPVDTITVPSAEDAFAYALARDGRYAKTDAEHGQVAPPAKAAWLDPSNEARYLTGVLGMAGGLQWAEAFLLHPFLMQMFGSLGGSPSVPQDKVGPALSRLVKRARSAPSIDLRDERDREALAAMIVKAGQDLKSPNVEVDFETLKAKWKEHREAFWQANPQGKGDDTSFDWDAHEEATLEACLISLRRRKMLFQGYRWTCPECHHRNWADLSSLKPTLACEVCNASKDAPVAIRWKFRPNEFLIESLRDHSVLSLIWVLATLRDRARRSFYYRPPTRLGPLDDEGRNTEADLLAVLDGKAILCEVKSSWQVTRTKDIQKLVTQALGLRPDRAILAVMENGAGPKDEIVKAKQELAAAGIEFEVMTPSQGDFRDDPHLPHDSDQR
jgi:hypothetical protein